MTLLNRYRRKGGFEQLLKLVESSTDKKKDQLLALIEQEDAGWAEMLKMKTITMEKIFSWDSVYIKDIVFSIKPRILGISLIGQPEDILEKVSSVMTEVKWVEVSDYLGDKYSEGEVHAARNQIIANTRSLEEQGYLRFQDVDPTLVLKAS